MGNCSTVTCTVVYEVTFVDGKDTVILDTSPKTCSVFYETAACNCTCTVAGVPYCTAFCMVFGKGTVDYLCDVAVPDGSTIVTCIVGCEGTVDRILVTLCTDGTSTVTPVTVGCKVTCEFGVSNFYITPTAPYGSTFL